jgi:O-antigen/teichoic acid export membrane protein
MSTTREPTVDRTFLREASVYTAANILNAAIPFLLLPVLTRVLAPAEYGMVAMFQACVAVVGAVAGLGLHGSIRVRYFKETPERMANYTGTCLLILAASGALAALGMAVISPVLAEVTGLSTWLLLLTVVTAIAGFVIRVRLVLFQAGGQALRYALVQLLQTLLNVSLSLWLVLGTDLGGEGRIGGIIIASVSVAIITLAWLWRRGDANLAWRADLAKEAFRFGFPLVPHTLAGIAVVMADRFVLSSTFSLATVGIYFAALQLASPVGILADSLNRAFMPWSFAHMKQGNNLQVVAASYLLMGVLTVAALAWSAMLYAGHVWIVGEAYTPDFTVLTLLVLARCFHGFYLVVAKGVFFAEKTTSLPRISGALGVMYMVAITFAAAPFGATGIAMLNMIHYLLLFLAVWRLGNRLFPQPWLELRAVRREVARILLPAVALRSNPPANNA